MNTLNKLLNDLSEHAKNKDFTFNRLYNLLYKREFYMETMAKLYPDKEIGIPEADGNTIAGFGEEQADRIIAAIRNQSYQPKPAQGVHISEKHGKKRPLGLPRLTDKLVQEVIREILNRIYEPTFSQYSHGFRENRSCHTALDSVQKRFNSVSWFIKGDISGCFDHIDHNVLMNILKKRIQDDRFLNLIRKFLNAGYLEQWTYHNTYSGCPQGSIIGPILANIYLSELDEFIETSIIPKYSHGKPKDKKRNPEYRRLESQMGKLKKLLNAEKDEEEKKRMVVEYKQLQNKKLKMPHYLPNNGEYASVKYVRYADDFLLGVIGSKKDCEDIKKEILEFLESKLHLRFPETTMPIIHSDKSVRFLEYDISVRKSNDIKRDKNGTKKRMFNRHIVLKVPKNTVFKVAKEKKLVRDLSSKHWMPIHRPELINLTDLEIILHFNSEVKGIYNYYSMAENISKVMNQLAYLFEYSCLKTFADKHRTTLGKFKKQHMVDNGTWGIKYKTKKGVNVVKFAKGFARKKPSKEQSVDIKPRNEIYTNSTTQLEERFLAYQCEICGKYDDNCQVHHINKVKNLKGKQNWERIMIAKKRKTLIVCPECHRKIHNGTL